MASYTTNYNLEKPAMNEKASPTPFNSNADILDKALKAVSDKADTADTKAGQAKTRADDAYALADGKADKEVIDTFTMLTSGWSDNEYSFEASYPVATYNISIELDGDSATDGQIEAWGNAKIRGSATANKCYCSETPAVDLPIIIKAVQK